jgi:hypothetical protein
MKMEFPGDDSFGKALLTANTLATPEAKTLIGFAKGDGGRNPPRWMVVTDESIPELVGHSIDFMCHGLGTLPTPLSETACDVWLSFLTSKMKP